MSKWSKLSDHEINCMVVDTLGFLSDCHIDQHRISRHCKDGELLHRVHEVSYCKNWSDIGSLIDYHKISLLNDGDKWEAEITYMANVGFYQTKEECSYFHTDENPKRAAAIVYLISKGVKV